jgi:hypothetical protein
MKCDQCSKDFMPGSGLECAGCERVFCPTCATAMDTCERCGRSFCAICSPEYIQIPSAITICNDCYGNFVEDTDFLFD